MAPARSASTGLTLVNQTAGTINANSSNSLTINASTTTNSGTLEATGGGTLNLQGTYNNASGTIAAGSSTRTGTVNILASITGGTLTSFGTSAMNLVGNGPISLTNVTISSGSTARCKPRRHPHHLSRCGDDHQQRHPCHALHHQRHRH